MAYDPIHRGQLYLRRAAHVLHSKGVLSVPESPEPPLRVEGAARERFFERGRRQTARLAAELEEFTGCELKSRRALDFGCGVGRLTLPLAERCEYVYGTDISRAKLAEADRNAKDANVTNVEWLEPELIPTLSGRYDMIHSILVFQHIPSREGERIFSELLRGLLPGGIGAVQVTLRPSRPAPATLGPAAANAPSGGRGPLSLVRGLDLSYPYMLLHSYSLNRLGGLLADAGVTDWHVRWSARSGAYQPVIIFFRKASAEAEVEQEDATDEVSARAPAPPRAPEPPADANAA
jgi:SAM-dependent methyltransferase